MTAEAMGAAPGMRDALDVLGAAAIVIPLFHRLRVSPVLGFMLVGMGVGPAGLGALVDRVPPLAWVSIADLGRTARRGCARRSRGRHLCHEPRGIC